MKVKVASTSTVVLLPENDSDCALICAWSEGHAQTVSSQLKDGRALSVAVGFFEVGKGKEWVALPRDLASRILNHLRHCRDDGPCGDGWQSKELAGDQEELKKILS